MQTPLLSIITITYNHESFIAKTIEGVLMQRVNFSIEFIIAEDCSTDNTLGIIVEYQKKYPDLIKVITSESNVGAVLNERRAMLAAKGKYIAFCEGDDYWTDPFKLQKQVDFLEQNPDYSVTFHRCEHIDAENNEIMQDKCDYMFENDEKQGVEIIIKMFFKQWITQPLTMVFRRDMLDLNMTMHYNYYRDMHLIYHLLQAGKGYLFCFVGGVRNIHDGGMHSKLKIEQQCELALNISEEIYRFNKSLDTKTYFLDTIQWLIYENCGELKNRKKALYLSFKHFQYSKSLRKLFTNLKRIIN